MMRDSKRVGTVAVGSALAAAVLAVALLGGCASKGELADQRGDYLSADGTVSQIAVENRTEPIAFEGLDESDRAVASTDFAGDILVVNFWYASCPPCRMEAPWLQELSDKFAPDGVQFLGVNVRDEAANARSFAEKFGITYPSIIDHEGEVVLAFAGVAPPSAVPTTIVLDREGRFAARIIGIIDQPVLDGLITAALEEDVP